MFPHRIPDLLDALKNEFESLIHDVKLYKLQRDEYERTIQVQYGELSNIQNSLFELERRHTSLQKKYEEELSRARSKEPNPIDKSNPNFRFQTLLSEPNHLPETKQPLLPSLSLHNNLSNNIGNISNGLGRTLTPINEQPTPAPLKFGSLNLPPTNNVHNNNIMNNSPPPNNTTFNIPPLNGSGGNAPLLKFPSAEQSFMIGMKRKDLSPDKTFPVNNNNDPPVKMIKKEAEEFRPIHLHPPSDLKDKTDDHNHSFTPSVRSVHDGEIDVGVSQELVHNSAVCCVKFSKDGKYLATGSKKKARIFTVADGKKYKTFSDFENEGELFLRSVCFSSDGKYLACGGEDKSIVIWNIEENKRAEILEGHTMDIYSLDYSPTGNLLASGSGDKRVKIWDPSKKKCIITLGENEAVGGPKDGVTSVVFSPDQRLIAAGSLDRIVRVWDIETGAQTAKFESHLDSVYSVSFSVDGKTIASGSLDKTLKLWDAERSRGCRSTLIGHTDFVLSVGFTPDDKWLISGSKDRSVHFWDPKTSIPNCKLEGHKNSVISIAISPTCGKFATGSGDNKAKIWDYKIATVDRLQ